MKALENRTMDSKREMEVLDALQDIRARNARIERAGQSDELLARLHMQEVEEEEEAEKKRLEEEDEELVKAVFSRVTIPQAGSSGEGSSATVTLKRKAEQEEPTYQALLSESAKSLITKAAPTPAVKKPKTGNKLGIKIVKKSGPKVSASS